MVVRNWYSPAQGSPVPWVVMDVNCWSEYREPFEWHRIDDADVDISSGELDFTTWTETGFAMKFVDTPGGTVITGATLVGGPGRDISFQDAADGQLLIVMSSTQTGALQTYLESVNKPTGSVVYGHLTGVDNNGDDRALFNATVHCYFGEQV